MQPEGNQDLLSRALERLGMDPGVTELPASLAGLTADFRPGKRWNPYFLPRTSDQTKYDIAAGFESYVSHLSDVFYHTDDHRPGPGGSTAFPDALRAGKHPGGTVADPGAAVCRAGTEAGTAAGKREDQHIQLPFRRRHRRGI